MTLAELQKLIADSRGEWEQIEFKRTTGELHGGMETLCAFLNGLGGRVLFGVTGAGVPQGQDVSDATFQEIANAIRRLEPPAQIEQVRIPLGGTREVVMLATTANADAPYTFDGRAYQRIGNTTSRMPQAEYERRLLARMQGRDRWENQVAEGYAEADLDLEEIDRMVRAAIQAGRLARQPADPTDALDRLNLRVDGRLRQAAVVLFGRRLMPDYPQCALRLARFKGTAKMEFLDQRQTHGHAFGILDEALEFIMRHIPVAGRIEPGKLERQDRPLYPPLALREGLVNAICHRDYGIIGGAVNVAIYDDRLEVISSGLLPAGITVADLKRDHTSHPRNPLIADVFYRRGYVEKWGRGTQNIVDWCVEAGQPEPQFEESAASVTVRFLPSGYHPPMRVSRDLTERQRRILLLLSDGQQWRVRDIRDKLPEAPAPRTLRDDLQLLKKLGMIASAGRSVAARWWLKQNVAEKGGEGRGKAEKGGARRR